MSKKEDDRRGADDYGRIMNRDGFSPDLPSILAPRTDSKGLSWSMRLLAYMLSGMRKGTLELHLPNGSVRTYEGREDGPHAVWRITSDRLIRHVLRNGEVGIGDSYLDDCWDTPDLTRLLMLLYMNEQYYKGPFEMNWLGTLYGYWQHRRRDNTKKVARKNIEAHYDLGNEFYKMWLDETMAYSSAMYIEPSQTLQDAQVNKFKLMFERLALKPEHTLLEVGSGWGGFAIHAARESGCRVHSITLSQEQLAEARVRAAAAAGVSDRVTFELRDYREVQGQYDRVVSIEMYEAVGEAFWPQYFSAISRALKPGGLAAIQGITIDKSYFEHYRTKRDFIQKYIFPGGMLCPPELFQELAGREGLTAESPRFFAKDYADTLAQWHRNVLDVREKIVEQFDERFLRMWRYYLSYCECGFRVGSIDLMQITLRKGM